MGSTRCSAGGSPAACSASLFSGAVQMACTFPAIARSLATRMYSYAACPATGAPDGHGVSDLQTREKYRSDHLGAAWEAVERGDLLLGGAVGDGPFTGLLIFAGENALEAARAFATADPYVTAGVVASWTARPWTTVVGKEAATPVRP